MNLYLITTCDGQSHYVVAKDVGSAHDLVVNKLLDAKDIKTAIGALDYTLVTDNVLVDEE